MAQFPVEAGYFNKKETIIPHCPLKMTIFGPSRVVREDRVFEKLLNSYIKELPGMPPSIVKCDIINNFFKLRTSDMSEPGEPKKRYTCMLLLIVHFLKRYMLLLSSVFVYFLYALYTIVYISITNLSLFTHEGMNRIIIHCS